MKKPKERERERERESPRLREMQEMKPQKAGDLQKKGREREMGPGGWRFGRVRLGLHGNQSRARGLVCLGSLNLGGKLQPSRRKKRKQYSWSRVERVLTEIIGLLPAFFWFCSVCLFIYFYFLVNCFFIIMSYGPILLN